MDHDFTLLCRGANAHPPLQARPLPGSDRAHVLEQEVVQLLRLEVPGDVDLEVARVPLLHHRLHDSVHREGLDLGHIGVEEAPVVAEERRHQLVGRSTLERLGQAAVVAEVQLLGALERGLLPPRLLEDEVQELEGGPRAPVADGPMEVHHRELFVRLEHAVDQVGHTEHLHLRALEVPHRTTLRERARSDAHAGGARGPGLRRLHGAPPRPNEAHHGPARLVGGLLVVHLDPVAEAALHHARLWVRGGARGPLRPRPGKRHELGLPLVHEPCHLFVGEQRGRHLDVLGGLRHNPFGGERLHQLLLGDIKVHDLLGLLDRHALGYACHDSGGVGWPEVFPVRDGFPVLLPIHGLLPPLAGLHRQPIVAHVAQHGEGDLVRLLEGDGLEDLHLKLVLVLGVHHRVGEGVALHDEIQLVHRGHGEALLADLFAVAAERRGVTLQLPRRHAVVTEAADLLHGDLDGALPRGGLRGDGEGQHHAPLAPRVGVVEVDGYEGGIALCIAGADAELEHGYHHAGHEGAPHVGEVGHGEHWELAEEAETELLQQLVLKHARHRGRRRHGPAAPHMLHRRPHLVPRPRGVGIVRHLRGHLERVRARGDDGRRWHGAERALDQRAHTLHAGPSFEVSHHVEGGVGREVPLGVEAAHGGAVPLLDLLLQPDGEALPEGVLQVEVGQELAVDAVLNGVHHLRLGQHRAALFLHARREELRLERDLVEGFEHLREHGLPGGGVPHGGVHVKHRVVKVGVGIAARPSAEELLALLRAEKGHVLDDVRNALLVILLVDGARVHLEVGLEALWGRGVRHDDVLHAVGQRPAHHLVVLRQLAREELLELVVRHRGRLLRGHCHHHQAVAFPGGCRMEVRGLGSVPALAGEREVPIRADARGTPP
mmetsp:Transcript_44355/g.141170  ORF Transcript_44355/g.141170 Transcript_44355/m.141170 type:complete len:887 (+) Transcript_44355:1013-3673(+)